MKYILTLIIAFSSLATRAQEPGLSGFADTLLQRARLTFVAPENYTQTEPMENYQMNWEFAFKHPKKKFEVRYAIRPLDEMVKEYEEFQKNKKEGDVMIDPNEVSKTLFITTLMNISNGNILSSVVFDADAVKAEFNADWGATAFLETNETFGKGYKYCCAMMIHKDNIGDAYIFFMSNNKDMILKEMQEVFHNLTFTAE